MKLLTNSRLKAARACQRLHKHQYLDRIRTAREPEATKFGTLIHSCLDPWFLAREGDDDARLEAVEKALADKPDADPYDQAKAWEMMRGYTFRWGGEPYRTVAVEQEFYAPLVNPITGRASRTWKIAGKLDKIVQDERGDLFLVEHKTSSEDVSPGSQYVRRLRLDGQVSIYYEGAASLGYHLKGVIYDVLKKPGLKPLQANTRRAVPETPEEYGERIREAIAADPAGFYQRADVVRLESERIEALCDIWQLAQQISEAEQEGRFPRNPDACMRWGRTCEFFDVCTGAASLDDPTQFVQLNTPFPELSATETQPEQAKEEPNHGDTSSSAAAGQ